MFSQNVSDQNSKAENHQEPVLSLAHGNTTYLIGLHFDESSKETLEDKVRKIIKKTVENDDF